MTDLLEWSDRCSERGGTKCRSVAGRAKGSMKGNMGLQHGSMRSHVLGSQCSSPDLGGQYHGLGLLVHG